MCISVGFQMFIVGAELLIMIRQKRQVSFNL